MEIMNILPLLVKKRTMVVSMKLEAKEGWETRPLKQRSNWEFSLLNEICEIWNPCEIWNLKSLTQRSCWKDMSQELKSSNKLKECPRSWQMLIAKKRIGHKYMPKGSNIFRITWVIKKKKKVTLVLVLFFFIFLIVYNKHCNFLDLENTAYPLTLVHFGMCAIYIDDKKFLKFEWSLG